MKPSTLLLSASLLANAALLAVYVSRSSSAPGPVGTAGSAPAGHAHPGSAPSLDALRKALDSGSAADLAAAGLPPDVARDLALGRTVARLAGQAKAAPGKGAGDGRWWRQRGGQAGAREEQLRSRRELADALRAALGTDLGLGGDEAGQLAFLSPEKREALRRITQDYDEMFAKFGSGGPQLASDREKLRLLRAERDRDIAALLTPDERISYEMRTSPSGATVRNRYGDAIETEDEFRKIFALQKAFDEQFPREALTGRISPEVLRARADAERQLDQDLRATVGDERYAALRRAADPDVRLIDSLVTRLSLPPATTNTVVAARDTFAAESQRINGDTAVPYPQRRTQIQDLAARAKADLVRTLGAEAADAYAQSSQWLNLLQNGMAYSTTPQAGAPGALLGSTQSVFPVLPAGAPGVGGTRQMFVSAAPGPDGAAGGDRTTSNVQVMTFSSTTEHGPANPPATGANRPVLVVPATPATPVPQPNP